MLITILAVYLQRHQLLLPRVLPVLVWLQPSSDLVLHCPASNSSSSSSSRRKSRANILLTVSGAVYDDAGFSQETAGIPVLWPVLLLLLVTFKLQAAVYMLLC
jgi:hypothetical protein